MQLGGALSSRLWLWLVLCLRGAEARGAPNVIELRQKKKRGRDLDFVVMGGE
jgi:hypothetical protein